MLIKLVQCLFLICSLTIVESFAGEKEDFLQMLDGKFRGRGKVILQGFC